MAIPKIIHYCWLSNDPVPVELTNYMSSWYRHMPDYKFIKWDFSRFNINQSDWVREAYENKKYAFAADYIRLYALYTMGGIYLDMDVEVVKPYDDLLDMDYFMCYENSSAMEPEVAAFGARSGLNWMKIMLDYYEGRHFIKGDHTYETTPLPHVVKTVLSQNGISLNLARSPKEMTCVGNNEIKLLPYEYFSPKSYATNKIEITPNTYSIHQFSGSWLPWEQRLERKIRLALGLRPISITYHLDKWVERLFHVKR